MNNKNSMVAMNLTAPEIKLILRLRQLRKTETRIFMVTTSPLSLSVMGQIELLELDTANICTSGSAA